MAVVLAVCVDVKESLLRATHEVRRGEKLLVSKVNDDGEEKKKKKNRGKKKTRAEKSHFRPGSISRKASIHYHSSNTIIEHGEAPVTPWK